MARLSHTTGWQQTPQRRPDKETKKDRKGKEQGKINIGEKKHQEMEDKSRQK
jgi:hypothetical protein